MQTTQILCYIAAGLGVVYGTDAKYGAANPATISAWVAQAWADAARPPNTGGYSIAWREETYSLLSSEEVTRLKREIGQRPEHPARAEVAHIEKHGLSIPVGVLNMRFMGDGGERWRYNIDHAPVGPKASAFSDSALTPSDAWQLKTHFLEIFDPEESRSASTPGSLRAHEFTFLPSLSRLIAGHFMQGRLASVVPGSIRLEGTEWSFVASVPDARPEQAFAIRYSGTWIGAENRGRVDACQIVSNGYKPETIGERELFRDHRWEPALSRWIAGRVERYTPEGRLWRVIVLTSVDPLPAGGLDACVRPPDPRGTDPFRGPATYTTIRDHREGVMKARHDNGETAILEALPPSPARGSSLRIIGWVSLAACVGALAWFRFRRS